MQLANRYLLVSRIAAGGMGEVWRARDQLLGREIAVKLLRSHVAGDPTFRERFRNEARITAGLADPGIAQVFDYGEQADLAYLVMELVPGEPLSAILARNGPLGPDVALDVIHQTAKALHVAHSSGIIHRDVKPGNILVTNDGVIKVTDFGIARALEAAPVTQTGTVLGTAQYVSPEQAQGASLTPSTDLYSLGIVAYECLAGRTPFQADSQVAIALQHLNEPPPPLGVDVPAPVRELVMTLLSKDPARRYGTALELADRAYVLRESLATLQQRADLSMLTDPAGFQVREPYGQEPMTEAAGGSAFATTDNLGGVRPRPRGKRTIVVFATAASVAAVGLGAFTMSQGQRIRPPEVAEPTPTLERPVEVRTSKIRTPTRRPTVVPAKSARPKATASATVSSSATPSQKPTPKPTPTPSTPTPTPTPTPSATPTTPTPTLTPDPGDTNPPKEET
ncbi:serine/threonine protein kinase [Nonomuraea sp. NBC_01738]|uniref:serine/threonine-protein kinase n=1 Tax=Nonomuraea sp. NBC_01738 TaxID=2976003 RepID=UPI002E1168AB|nr:serine/threonine protein kinase [Nonomuraea sp. NBC_01738]